MVASQPQFPTTLVAGLINTNYKQKPGSIQQKSPFSVECASSEYLDPEAL